MNGPARWHSMNPAQFTDHRYRMVRNVDYIVNQNVRAWRGVAGRNSATARKLDVVRCDHAHAKPSSARKCGELLARRLNREEGLK